MSCDSARVVHSIVAPAHGRRQGLQFNGEEAQARSRLLVVIGGVRGAGAQALGVGQGRAFDPPAPRRRARGRPERLPAEGRGEARGRARRRGRLQIRPRERARRAGRRRLRALRPQLDPRQRAAGIQRHGAGVRADALGEDARDGERRAARRAERPHPARGGRALRAAPRGDDGARVVHADLLRGGPRPPQLLEGRRPRHAADQGLDGDGVLAADGRARPRLLARRRDGGDCPRRRQPRDGSDEDECALVAVRAIPFGAQFFSARNSRRAILRRRPCPLAHTGPTR